MPSKHSKAVPFLETKEPSQPTKPKKPDFSKYKPFRNLIPVRFVIDSGEEFDIDIIKSTVASYHIYIKREDQVVSRLKVRKTNHRLRYKLDGRLLTPDEVINRKG